MGIVQLPRIELCCQRSHPVIYTDGIAKIMSLVCFQQTWQFLHLANSEEESQDEILCKVRKFLDILLPKFKQEFNLNHEATVDEDSISLIFNPL